MRNQQTSIKQARCFFFFGSFESVFALNSILKQFCHLELVKIFQIVCFLCIVFKIKAIIDCKLMTNNDRPMWSFFPVVHYFYRITFFFIFTSFYLHILTTQILLKLFFLSRLLFQICVGQLSLFLGIFIYIYIESSLWSLVHSRLFGVCSSS